MAGGNHASYARIGFAVLAGAVTTVVTLVYLGGLRGRGAEILVETYSDREVSGLSVGSAVNFRGVKIGEVREIDFVGNRYEAKGDDNLRIYILMALDARKLGYYEDEGIRQEDTIPYLVKARGLRATVTASGITGLSRIESDLHEGVRPPKPLPWTPRHTFVPSRSSLLDNFSDAATRVMNQVNAMDLSSVWSNVSASVRSLSQTLQTVQTGLESRQGDVEKTVENLSDAAASLREFADEVKGNPSLILRDRRPEPLDETR